MFVEIMIGEADCELLTFSQPFRAFSNFLSLACSSFLAFSRRFACSLIFISDLLDFNDRFLVNRLLTENESILENGPFTVNVLLIIVNGEDLSEVLTTENGEDLDFTDP